MGLYYTNDVAFVFQFNHFQSGSAPFPQMRSGNVHSNDNATMKITTACSQKTQPPLQKLLNPHMNVTSLAQRKEQKSTIVDEKLQFL